jgi:plastocyanin
MRRAWILLPVLVLAGCGGGGGGSNESEQGGAVMQSVQISEKEYSLSPSSVDLSKTGTYEFKVTNDGQITHALEIEGNGVEDETEDIEPGQTMTLKVTLSKAGSYEMYCPIDGHKEQGMKGSVTVGGTSGGGGTTTNETTTTAPGY